MTEDSESHDDAAMTGAVARYRRIARVLDSQSRASLGVAVVCLALTPPAYLAALLVARAGNVRLAVAFGAVTAAITIARRAIQSRVLRRVRERITSVVARGMLSPENLLAEPDADAEPLTQFFDGGYLVAKALAETVPDLVGDAAATLALAAILAAVEPPSGVAAVAVGAFASALTAITMRRRTTSSFATAHARLVELVAPLTALARAPEQIVASGRSESYLADVEAKIARWAIATASADLVASAGLRVPALVVGASAATAVILAKGGVTGVGFDDLLSLGALACVLPPLAGLLRATFDLARVAPKLGAIAPYFEPAPTASPTRLGVPAAPSPISWKSVSYAYPDAAGGAHGRGVVEQFDGEWAVGTVTALCGPNGSGKSTIIRLLLGIVRPTRGEIRVGGVPLADLDIDAWRRLIAYVPQRPYFPERATIRDGLAFGGLETTDDVAEHLLDEVGLLDAIHSAGNSQPLDVRIASLSAGQRQRVALARAFREDARVVVLDEPDANLDVEGIALVRTLLRALARTRVVVVAAHSSEILRAADLVVDLDRGRALARRPHPREQDGAA